MNIKDISVIIPTFNRLDILKESLKAWRKVQKATRYSFELIYADNDSPDGTVEYLQKISDLPIIALKGVRSSLSYRRNLAICASTGKRILFAGDDIFPQADFLNQHIEIGNRIGKQHALLGNVVWHPELPMTHLLKHITEIGCEQFDFEHLIPNAYTNYQHFYTANVSIGREMLYQEDFFFNESFPEPNFEDIELAFRLSKRGMAIFYAPEIIGYHYHPYTTAGFCQRQLSAGRMAAHFVKLQPNVDQMLGINKLEKQFALFSENKSTTMRLNFLPNILELQKIIGRYEKYLVIHHNSFSLQRTLSDYYLRLFQYMYEKGILESLAYSSEAIDLFLTQKFFSFDTFLANQQQEIEISTNANIPLLEKESFFTYWGKMNTKSKTEADIRLVWWRRRFESSRLWSYYTFHQKYKQAILYSQPMQIIHQFWNIRRKILGKIYGHWVQFYFQHFLHPTENYRCISVIVEHQPSKEILQKYFSLFNNKEVILLIKNNQTYNKISAITPNAVLTKRSIINSKFIWKIKGEFELTHLIILHNILLTLSFLNLDYLLLDSKQKEKRIVQEYYPQNLVVATTQQSLPLESLTLGKKISIPYLPASKTGINFDSSLNIINQNYLLGNNIKNGYKRLNWDLIRLPKNSFLNIKKEKPIIFVFPTFLAVGGVEKNTLAIIKELQDTYDFVIINFEPLQYSQGSLHSEFLPYVKAIYDLGETIPFELYLKAIEFLKENYQPDFIWICNGSPWLAKNLEAIRSIFSNIPIIDQQVYDTAAGWISEYGHDSIKKLDRYIATNKRIARVFIEKYNLPSQKIDLIYPCLDASRVKQANRRALSTEDIIQKYNLPTNKTILTFIGRIAEQKRPMWFVDLAKKLNQDSRLHFVMIGDGYLSQDIDGVIAKNKLTNITRIPYTPNPCEILRVSSALIILSEYEGLPISLLESLAMGIPFFSTDVGGIRDLQEEYESGCIATSGALEQIEIELINFIHQISKYKQNAEKYSNIVLNRFMSKTIAKQYQNCFMKASAQHEIKA